MEGISAVKQVHEVLLEAPGRHGCFSTPGLGSILGPLGILSVLDRIEDTLRFLDMARQNLFRVFKIRQALKILVGGQRCVLVEFDINQIEEFHLRACCEIEDLGQAVEGVTSHDIGMQEAAVVGW